MLLDLHATDPDLALFMLNQIDTLYVMNGQAQIDSRFKQLVGASWQSAYQPGGGDQPTWYAGFGSGYSVFIGGGTENYVQGQTLFDGYTDRVTQPAYGDPNTFLVTLTNRLSAQAWFAPWLGTPNAVLTGHSLGGAWAALLARIVNVARPNNVPKVVTFGAPRTGGRRFREAYGPLPTARWMNDTDPVPLVPPTVEQVPVLVTGVSLGLLLAYANQRHTFGGLQLDNMGLVTAQDIPQLAAVSPTMNLASWLVGLVRNTASPHQTSEYRRRLMLFRGPVNVPPPQVERPAEGELAPPVPIGVVRAEIRTAKESIVGSGIAQGQGPLIVPKKRIFSVKKFGSVWYTTLGGVPFSVGPRRKRAGLLAVEGNAFVKRLLRQGVVDPTTLDQQFQLFLIAAQDPTSGIRPQLNLGPV
jgi:Lipase (class 3)